MDKLQASHFRELTRKGIENVVRDRQILNDINVFPVADNDTGDNLVNTLLPVYRQLDQFASERLDVFLNSLAATMLNYARGNSGIIFSQFFHSLALAVNGAEHLAPRQFARALESASKATYEALATPREGTILTVISHTAAAFREAANSGALFDTIFASVRDKVHLVLEKTRDMLPQLKKAGVVDSGGLGFFLFLDGMAEFFRDHLPQALREKTGPARIQFPENTSPRYCAQWRFHPYGGDRRLLMQLLNPHGESLIISGNSDLFVIHLHTDQPESAEKVLCGHGEIVSRHLESLDPEEKKRGRLKTKLVVDSAVDFPDSWAEIEVVPLTVFFKDREWRDNIDISREDFFRIMGSEPQLAMKTSQPAPGAFAAVLRPLLQTGSDVILMTISSALSGTWQSARNSLQLLEEKQRGQIYILDTLNLSGGAGILLGEARRMLADGLGAPEILARLQEMRPFINSLGYVEDISHAARGGRAPAMLVKLIKFLGLKPLVAFKDGRMKKAGFLFSGKNKEARVVKRLSADMDKEKWHWVAVACSDSLEPAGEIRRLLSTAGFDKIHFLTVTTSAALGVHTGPGTFCVFTMPCSEISAGRPAAE